MKWSYFCSSDSDKQMQHFVDTNVPRECGSGGGGSSDSTAAPGGGETTGGGVREGQGTGQTDGGGGQTNQGQKRTLEEKIKECKQLDGGKHGVSIDVSMRIHHRPLNELNLLQSISKASSGPAMATKEGSRTAPWLQEAEDRRKRRRLRLLKQKRSALMRVPRWMPSSPTHCRGTVRVGTTGGRGEYATKLTPLILIPRLIVPHQ